MAGSGITKAAPLKSGIHEKKKEDGMKQSQKLLLTWLIEDTRLFDSIKGWITEEDFTEPLYRKAAQELFTQYGESGQVNPAKMPMIHTQTMMEKDCFLQEVLMGIHIRQFYCPGIKLQTE